MNLLDLINFHLCDRYSNEAIMQPKPYFTLLLKFIEDASLKYFVGQVISPISKFFMNICVKT